MKKLTILFACIIMMTSCSTNVFNGAMFGGIIGSAIGGITGGPRGSDVGTLIGMATGATTGAAIESAVRNAGQNSDEPETPITERDPAAYHTPSVSNNGITVTDNAKDATSTQIEIRNPKFTNDSNTDYISAGETVSISFEIYNVSGESLTNIVPMVVETTRNKRLAVSPSILIESLGAGKAIRYTAYITARDNLRHGTATFRLSVMSANNTISNTITLDIPLE